VKRVVAVPYPLVSSVHVLSRLEDPTVARRVALGIVAVTLVGLLAYGIAMNWVPWSRECDPNPSCHVLAGETLAALENARHFVADGSRYWLLQRHVEEGHTLTYFHNVNLGAFVVYGTALLGARTPMPAAVLSAVAFVAGLGYAYLFVERASGGRRFALVFLVLFAGELYHNTLLGLNLLRAWHWLPLFGVAYHTLGIAQRRAVRLRDVLPLALLATIGLGAGYEIFAFVGATAVWTMLLFGAGWRLRLWATLVAAFAIPVLLRQVQVIGGVGATLWATDLYYTAGLKAPLLRAILPLPPADEIDLWYRENQIFRGAANSLPITDALDLLFTSGRHLQWLNELGAITLLATLLGLVAAIVLVVRDRDGVPGTPARRARTVLCLFLGLGTGFLVFGYHALYYFVVVHQLPLIVAPVCLAVAFAASLLLDATARPMPVRVAVLVGLGLLLGERLYKQWANLYGMGLRAHPPTTRWGTFDVGPPGGMYGQAGTIVLGIAGLVLLAVLCAAAFAFLRVRPVGGSACLRGSEPLAAGPAALS
jgi:hypothetical protein